MPSGTERKRRGGTVPPDDAARIQGGLQHALAVLRGDPRAALLLAEDALATADALGAADLQAEARLVRAHACRLAGEHAAAVEDYQRARRLYRRLGRPVDAARTAAGALDSLRSLGRTAEALRLAGQARRVFHRHAEPTRAAILDASLGGLYFQQGAYARALRLWERARPVLQAAGRSEDVAGLDNNAANALTQLDRLQEAEALYASARALYAARGMRATEASVDVNLGYLAYRQGRYGAAVDTLRRAAAVFDTLGKGSSAIITRLDLAEVYLALNLLDEAAGLAAEQLRLAREASIPHEAARAAF
jgi:tetratricopeptide (TPR) repeat protein